MKRPLSSAALVLLVAISARGAEQDQPLRTGTTAVVIDVTALDGKGGPVLDLRAEDFELSEDGKRQQIAAVTLVREGVRMPAGSAPGVSGGGAVPQKAVAENGRPVARADGGSPAETPTLTAILFDSLSHEQRPVAGKAALAYLSTLSRPRDYAGVFLADMQLRTFAPFTNEPEVLNQAVERLMATAPTQIRVQPGSGNAITRGLPVDPNSPPTAGVEASGGYINAREREKYLVLEPGPEALLRRLELRMLEAQQRFMHELGGQTSLAALRGVVAGLSELPGRKSILYFAEQLSVTDRLKPRFDALIAEANRANITIYTVDAAGLRVHSEEATVARNVDLAGAQGVGDARREDGPWTRDLEKQNQLLVSRTAAALGTLSRDTGGFLLQNTNNLAAGLARMQVERQSYYLIAYQPTNTAQDGKFRRVQVKVKRSGVSVRARPGYRAPVAAK